MRGRSGVEEAMHMAGAWVSVRLVGSGSEDAGCYQRTKVSHAYFKPIVAGDSKHVDIRYYWGVGHASCQRQRYTQSIPRSTATHFD